MRLDEMELLLRVAETGSMTLAARQMNRTPAAVSASVKRLEAELGVRVFDRTTRSVQPTDEGLLVLEGCQDVVERWQQALEGIRGAERELAGSIHVSAPADTSYQVLAPVAVEVAAAHPKLDIVVHSSDAVHHLHRDAIDMAIRYGPLQDSALTARKLAQWPGVLVASPAYLEQHGRPERPEQLADHRLLTLQLSSIPNRSWSLRAEAGPRQLEIESNLCGDGYLTRQWASEGRGIALKSLFDVIDDLESGRLVRVLPAYSSGPMPIHALFPSRRYMPARVRAFDIALSAAFEARSRRCASWLRSQQPG